MRLFVCFEGASVVKINADLRWKHSGKDRYWPGHKAKFLSRQYRPHGRLDECWTQFHWTRGSGQRLHHLPWRHEERCRNGVGLGGVVGVSGFRGGGDDFGIRSGRNNHTSIGAFPELMPGCSATHTCTELIRSSDVVWGLLDHVLRFLGLLIGASGRGQNVSGVV